MTTSKEVVDTYVELASDWIEKADNNEALDKCYPLDENR
jgi:hypothetical protein